MNLLTVKNCTKYYGSRLLFEDLTFFIEQGQKVALIAKNGAGKSTLMKCLFGIYGQVVPDCQSHSKRY